jgi:hypothetical protein
MKIRGRDNGGKYQEGISEHRRVVRIQSLGYFMGPVISLTVLSSPQTLTHEQYSLMFHF